MAFEVGRVCMKIAGHEAGRYCTVLKKIDKQFVLVNGPRILTGVKRRKCNLAHLEALPYSLEVSENSTDQELIKAYQKAKLVEKFNLKLPSAADLKTRGEKKEEVMEVKKEEPRKEEKKEEKKKEVVEKKEEKKKETKVKEKEKGKRRFKISVKPST